MLTLYSKETTSFSTLGIGVLRDFISHPLITEELNGAYTLEFEYAKDGYLSEYLIEQNIIKANGQAFRIWNIKKDMQKITVFAKHIFFDLSFNFLADVFPTNLTAQSALAWMLNRAAVATNFSATGNCTQTASTRYVRKNFIDAVFNEDNALLKKFGGELSYDNFNITVHDHRGTNANFSIRYKKNLTGIDFNLDFSNVATRIVPIGFDGLTIDSTYVESPRASNYFTPLYKTYEFNDIKYDPDDEEAYHTLAEAKQALINAANDLFTKNVDLPQVSISVNFVELSKCSEYASYSNLETVHLGDTIDVIIPELNIHTSARVNKTVYDCILDRFITLEIGSAKQSITRSQIVIENQIRKSENYLTQAQHNAENLINHPFNGNVYIDKENGVIYLMDSTSPETAQNVWKWSLGGLGFSSTGINGTYTVAILQDGRINADFITTGQLNTGVIQGYDSLLIQVDTLDREFQKEINPTDVASGSSITLEDSAETELIDFELEGKTEQATRSGKNLLKYPYYATLPTTQAGVTWEDDNGKIIASGTATGYSGFTLVSNIPVQANTNYRFYIVGTQTNVSIDISGTGLGINIPTTSLNNSGFVFNTGNATAITLNVKRQNSLSTSANFYPMLVIGTDTSTDYEPYGVMPSPDYPSELVSVGYKNYFTLDYITAAGITKNDSEKNDFTYTDCWGRDIVLNANIVKMLKPSTTYTIKYKYQVLERPSSFGQYNSTYNLGLYNGSQMIWLGNTNKNSIDLNTWETITATFTTPASLTNYRILAYNFKDTNNTTTGIIRISELIITEKESDFIPFGKYGIQIKNIWKNLFNKDNYQNLISDFSYNIASYHIKPIQLMPNTNYTVSHNAPSSSSNVVILINNIQQVNGTNYYDLRNASGMKTITTDNTGCLYIGVPYYYTDENYNNRINECNIQIEQGTQATEYESYKSNTYLYTLDNQLRSIGDTKDLLYIKNGMLYVDRKIGKVVFNGSEGWGKGTVFYLSTAFPNDNKAQSAKLPLSNYFGASANASVDNTIFIPGTAGTSNRMIWLKSSKFDTANDLKTWLSTHNTEVQYILAEPYTEEIGKTQIPITYKGITHINTTDELEPNMSITYVRDTLIANYVESYVREIKITENGIESRVQNIEESDYGSRINAVEERTTDTEKNIEVISTNIDTTTGEVRKVTTTNGMTFDENGLNIHTNQSTFNAQHTYEGTYYRDGDEVITETTINGFKATNLKNKGQHEYSYDDTHDLYEFIDERIEVDGEYCYATFYNGEE